jgi:two-component system, OmpR family, sensor histidine kinase SenX3
MDTAWLLPVGLVVGGVIGAGVMLLLLVAARLGRRAASVASSAVPDGVDQMLDALEAAGVVVDPSNEVVRASHGALALGLVSHGALAHPELRELVDRVRRDGEPVTAQVELTRRPIGSQTLLMSVRAARIGTRFVMLLADDRTEAHRLEEVRRDFVANISHELKTPIGAIGLLAEALESADDDPDAVRRFAARLRHESGRLAVLTQEIIELSRLQATDGVEHAEVVPIDDVIAQAIDQNRVAATASELRLARGGEEGAVVFGDRRMLVMAVHNLVANAIQYSPPGRRVGVGVRVDGGIVEIAVTDQGVGIAADEVDRVFERFFRIDPARSRNTGGSGLGLSIVKHVVQNHGGDVRVWSRPGHGSTFTIRLPEAEPSALPIRERARS